MFTIVNNTPTEEAVEETATPNPTATPQPKQSKVAVRTAKVERNDYGRYELTLRLQNNETSSVDRVDFYVRCYNAYGELTKAYNHYDMTELCYDLTIRSGALSDPDLYWRLNGYSDIKAVEIAVKKYHTTDGKTVEIPDDELSWKKF